MDGLGSACPPVARTTTTGDGGSLCTWPHTFSFKPISAFGLLDLATFISSSPELAMPSTLAPDRLGVGSRWIPSRDIQPPEGEVTLSQELRTVGLLRPHVLVGYRWSYIGLCPGCKSSHNRHIRSFISQPPQVQTCALNASGSSSHAFATLLCRPWTTRARGRHEWHVEDSDIHNLTQNLPQSRRREQSSRAFALGPFGAV